jgi:plasmid maintenance system antidote protein VapI
MSSPRFHSGRLFPVGEYNKMLSYNIYTTLDTYGKRIDWLLRTRRKKQKDLCDALGRHSGFVSEVVNDKKEFNWDDTAKMVEFLNTNGSFFLGLTDNDAPIPEVEREQAPYHKHAESDRIARICDAAPEWLRQQMLAVAEAQLSTAQTAATEVGLGEWHERLKTVVAMSGLVIGEERTRRIAAEIDTVVSDLLRQRSTVEAMSR